MSRRSRRCGTGALVLLGLALPLAACSPAVPGSAATSTTAATGAPSSAPTAAESPISASEAPTSASQAPISAAQAPTSAMQGPRAATDPASPLVVVNKRLPLTPIDYAPPLTVPAVPLAVAGEGAQLNPTTARAAEAMFAAAARDGAPMALLSGYRSYATQAATYSGWVARQGQEAADVASARPGYSEHQTGFAFDIADPSGACSLVLCFKDTAAGAWAAAHAHEHGFIVRYPWWHHGTTGYYYEPWHLRYIGVEAATDMRARGIATLEEYLGLPAAPGY